MNLPHEFVVAPFNNIPETQEVLDALPPDSLGAILIEPVQGSGGCRPASPEFLKYLRQTADKLGALLVIDEVMTSRLGPSGATATIGLKADLMTLGKWIGGGMTFGAFGGRSDIMALFDPALAPRGLAHPGTYNNNVFSMSAGIVGLDIFNSDTVSKLNSRGDRMKAAITKILFEAGIYLSEHATLLTDVIEMDSLKTKTILYSGSSEGAVPSMTLPRMFISGRGSMLNVRFAGADAELWQNLYYHHMLEKGIYLASRGYTPLHLEITDEDVNIYVNAVSDFVRKHGAELRQNL
jgi:glutamate-1-semialdehyde 2,1-aminomutase